MAKNEGKNLFNWIRLAPIKENLKVKKVKLCALAKILLFNSKKSFKKIFQNRLTFFNKEPERIVQALLFAHRESGEKGFNKVESLFSNPLPAYSTALPILFKRMLLRPSADQ